MLLPTDEDRVQTRTMRLRKYGYRVPCLSMQECVQQEEAMRLEMLEEVDKSRGETQAAISVLAEDLTEFVSKQGEAAEGVVARAAATEEEFGRRLDALTEQCKVRAHELLQLDPQWL